MKCNFAASGFLRGLSIAVFAAVLASVAHAATSEITPVEKRRVVVESAGRLAKPGSAAPLPENLALPFSPPGFDLTDAQERDAAATTNNGTVVVRPKTRTDLEILEELAAKIPPSGSIFLPGGEARLTFGKQTVKMGAHFNVPLNGQDHDVELVKIESTTFTLRYKREEITRPINPAKSPSP